MRFNGGNSAFEHKRENVAFAEEALSAFGKKQNISAGQINDPAFQNRTTRGNFSEDATAAFGKKSSKRGDPDTQASKILGQFQHDAAQDWTSSALRTKTEKPSIVTLAAEDEFPTLAKKTEEEFPSLGSGKSSKTKSSPSMSFASLVKKRAEEDAKEAEELAKAEAKRLDILKRRKEERDRYKRSQKLLAGDNILRRGQAEEDLEDDVSYTEDDVNPDEPDSEVEQEADDKADYYD